MQRFPTGRPTCSRCSRTRGAGSTSRSPRRGRGTSRSSRRRGSRSASSATCSRRASTRTSPSGRPPRRRSRIRPCVGRREFLGFPAAAGAFTSGGTVSNMTALAAARERAIPGSRRHAGSQVARPRSTARARPTTRSSARPRCSGSGPTTCARCRSTATGASCPRRLPRRSAPTAPQGVCRLQWSPRPAPRSPAPSTRSGPRRRLRGRGRLAPRRRGLRGAGRDRSVGGALVRRARPRGLGHARCAQVALPPEGLRRPARAPSRGPLRCVLAQRVVHPARARTGCTWSTSRSSIRGPFRALKLWLAFRAHGAEAFREAVENNLRQARLLYELVVANDAFEPLCGPPPLSIVPFRHVALRRRPQPAQRAARAQAPG